MSDATDAERKLVSTCIAWDCENKVHPPAVFCPTHAQQAQPGIVEPALEARARQAGEAELRRIREEQPLVLDIGEIPAPALRPLPPHLPGEIEFDQDPSKAAAKLVKRALKGKFGPRHTRLAWALVEVLQYSEEQPPHPR